MNNNRFCKVLGDLKTTFNIIFWRVVLFLSALQIEPKGLSLMSRRSLKRLLVFSNLLSLHVDWHFLFGKHWSFRLCVGLWKEQKATWQLLTLSGCSGRCLLRQGPRTGHTRDQLVSPLSTAQQIFHKRGQKIELVMEGTVWHRTQPQPGVNFRAFTYWPKTSFGFFPEVGSCST